MIYVFRANVHNMVEGMDDTVVVAIEADSWEEAKDKVIETTYKQRFIQEVFPKEDFHPSHSTPEYVGTMEELMKQGEYINLSHGEFDESQ